MRNEFLEAIKAGQRERVAALLDQRPALLDQRADGAASPLLLSIYYQKPAVAALLRERAADPHAQSEAGQTSLDIAREHKRQPLVELLDALAGPA